MEEVLKAEHCREPAKGIQLCAIVVAGAVARMASSAVLVLRPFDDLFWVA
jgi:hypothetical protein